MQNNLTKKEIDNLYNWAKKYDIKELKTKDRKKLLNIKKLYIFSRNLKVLPKEIENLINLEELIIGDYIVGGTIKKLPKEIGGGYRGWHYRILQSGITLYKTSVPW